MLAAAAVAVAVSCIHRFFLSQIAVWTEGDVSPDDGTVAVMKVGDEGEGAERGKKCAGRGTMAKRVPRAGCA